MSEEDLRVRIEFLEGHLRDMAVTMAKEGGNKLAAIRAYRAATGATLRDAKDFVETIYTSATRSEEDSRLQRVEDRLHYLEGRVGRIERAPAVATDV